MRNVYLIGHFSDKVAIAIGDGVEERNKGKGLFTIPDGCAVVVFESCMKSVKYGNVSVDEYDRSFEIALMAFSEFGAKGEPDPDEEEE